jgi:hypothetical protein
LKFYGDGYYLEPANGFVMKMPNIALKEQLQSDCEHVPEDILERMRSASESFYRFDSDMETKKKAICSLADILESFREPLKQTLSQEYEINQNEHDKLIFEIVNRFNIRHDKADQLTGYSRDIWYEWAMQYYTSVIIVNLNLTIKIYCLCYQQSKGKTQIGCLVFSTISLTKIGFQCVQLYQRHLLSM